MGLTEERRYIQIPALDLEASEMFLAWVFCLLSFVEQPLFGFWWLVALNRPIAFVLRAAHCAWLYVATVVGSENLDTTSHTVSHTHTSTRAAHHNIY